MIREMSSSPDSRWGLCSRAAVRWVAALVTGALLSAALLLAGGARGMPSARAAAQCSRTRQLAYVDAKYAGAKGMVSVAAADGSGRQQLFEAATPELSPNGRMIAVTDFGGASGLGIFDVCGGLVGEYFSSRDAVTGIVWSPDSSLVAAVVDPHPMGSAFGQHLQIVDVATKQVSNVATGFLNGFGGPSFSPTTPDRVAYEVIPHVDANADIWSAMIGRPAQQLTRGGSNEFPLWGPQGILYEQTPNSGLPELDLISGGHSRPIMRLNGWPVALSSDGLHLAAEGAACGVVWPLSVNLATRKVVAKLANGFAPFGISPPGGSLLIAGSPPGLDCGGPRSVIETVPFGGGKPTVIADGTDPSWADSSAVSVQDFRGAATNARANRGAEKHMR